jgi:DNA-binding GntR family transcriptional regulator
MSEIIQKLNPMQNTVEQVHVILRKEIIDMRLQPGEAISEKELCERFEISRTPVREACLRLSFENLVEIFPQRGTFVSKIRRQDVREDHFIRGALETATIQFAARHLTRKDKENLSEILDKQQICVDSNESEKLYQLDQILHKYLAQVGHSDRVWNVIENAKLQLNRVRMLTYPMAGYMQIIVDQHRDIVERLCSGDEEKAVAAMKIHLNDVLQRFEILIKDYPDYFI